MVRPRPGHGWGIVIVLGFVLVGSTLDARDKAAQGGPPPAPDHPPAGTSTQLLTGEWLQRRVGLQELALPSGFIDHHFIPDTVEELDLRSSQAESIDELPPNLRRLDLRDSSAKRLGRLPSKLEWLDIRGTDLTALPLTALPKNLRHLGVDGTVVREWIEEGNGELPGDLRSLVVYRPPAALLDLPLPESLEALGVTQGDVTSLEGPPGLPHRLRRLCLEETELKDLKGAPESLDELHLLGSTSLEGLPPYVTRLVLGTGAVLRLTRDGPAPRFLQVLEVSGGRVVGGFDSLPLLAAVETDELTMAAEVSDPLPWLRQLKLVADDAGLTEEQLTWLAKQGHGLELELAIESLDDLEDRLDDFKGLRGLSLKMPYEGGNLPAGLTELNVQLREVALPGVPGLERLTVRHRGSGRLVDLLPAKLPDSLVELRIDSNVAEAALPAGWAPPPRLQELALDGVALRPWINSLQSEPEKVLPNLEEVVLRDVGLDHLDWLPLTVTRLLLLDGHPEEKDGILDGCS